MARDGPRIAVVGNCQARGVAAAVEVLVPQARVTLMPLGRLRRDHASIEALMRTYAGFDHVFTQAVPPSFLPAGDYTRLDTLGARRVLYPTIVFPAFHPDMIYVGAVGNLAEAHLVPSPMGHYHSAIALFAYLRGLDEARTARLFREDVMEALGYLDGWASATGDLLRTAGEVGFDLGPALRRWTRRGPFMHVFNHPRLPVLADLARGLVARAGLGEPEVAVEDYLADDLARDVVWPVYPAVAERYGVTGSTIFKAKPRGSAPPVIHDLPGFIAASFAVYRMQAPAALTAPRLAAWAGDPRVCAIFDGER